MRKRTKVVARHFVLVPLKPNGFALGYVVLANGKGQAFGTFWGPRLIDELGGAIEGRPKSQPVLVCRFGDYGIRTGGWRILGPVRSREDNDWPRPIFWRKHSDPNRCYISTYDDDLKLLSEKVRPIGEAGELPYDAQLGSGVVETRLSDMLA